MAGHNAIIDWTAQADEDFAVGHYSRKHVITFDAGVSLPGSASPSVVRAPWSIEAAADPEEMLVAALSSCHMLTFLDKARRAGFVVTSYHDAAEGFMGKTEAGRFAVTKVILRPEIAFAEPAPSAEALAELHHAAHEDCFIANSVKTEVMIGG